MNLIYLIPGIGFNLLSHTSSRGNTDIPICEPLTDLTRLLLLEYPIKIILLGNNLKICVYHVSNSQKEQLAATIGYISMLQARHHTTMCDWQIYGVKRTKARKQKS